MDVQSVVKFTMDVAPTLKDAFQNLLLIQGNAKPELIVVFLYNTMEESLYIRMADVEAAIAQIVREEENDKENMYKPRRRVLLAPVLFICDSKSIVNVQAFATMTQSWV